MITTLSRNNQAAGARLLTKDSNCTAMENPMSKPDATTGQMLNLIAKKCVSIYFYSCTQSERGVEQFVRLLWYIELKVKTISIFLVKFLLLEESQIYPV
jgi:hypothetical protein